MTDGYVTSDQGERIPVLRIRAFVVTWRRHPIRSARIWATRLGWSLLRPDRPRPVKRFGSFLYHWGSGRIDLYWGDR